MEIFSYLISENLFPRVGGCGELFEYYDLSWTEIRRGIVILGLGNRCHVEEAEGCNWEVIPLVWH